MSGLILPPQETTVIRGVAKSAALLFTLMFIERTYPGRPASEAELALLMQIDERTVRKQATALSALGLVTSQGDRWLLTPDGRRTLFGATPQPAILSIENSEQPYLEGEISAQNVLHDMNDDDLTKNVDSESSSSSERTKCAALQILQATAILFEDAVFVAPGMSDLDPDFVLGWVAKVYADRHRLYNPLGLLYRRLNEMASLPVIYRKNPTRGLPAEFLREIGMEVAGVEAQTTEDNLQKRYSDGEFSEYFHRDDTPSRERNERWISIMRKLPNVSGCGCHGYERVETQGSLMRVFVANVWNKENRAEYFNTHLGVAASSIYAEQCGDPSARVEFVLEDA